MEYLSSQDCVLIVTDHSAYDWNWIGQHAPLIVDTRNAMKNAISPRSESYRPSAVYEQRPKSGLGLWWTSDPYDSVRHSRAVDCAR